LLKPSGLYRVLMKCDPSDAGATATDLVINTRLAIGEALAPASVDPPVRSTARITDDGLLLNPLTVKD